MCGKVLVKADMERGTATSLSLHRMCFLRIVFSIADMEKRPSSVKRDMEKRDRNHSLVDPHA